MDHKHSAHPLPIPLSAVEGVDWPAPAGGMQAVAPATGMSRVGANAPKTAALFFKRTATLGLVGAGLVGLAAAPERRRR